MVIDKLRELLRTPVWVEGYYSRQSTHEAIKAQLYVAAFRLGLIPILEASPNGQKDRKKIDCLFLRGGIPYCGIEIDYSIKKASILKLQQLNNDVEKIIISYGRQAARSKALFRHREHLGDIKSFILYPLIR